MLYKLGLALICTVFLSCRYTTRAYAPDELWVKCYPHVELPEIALRSFGIEEEGQIVDARSSERSSERLYSISRLIFLNPCGTSRNVLVFARQYRTEVGGPHIFSERHYVCYVYAGERRGDWFKYRLVTDDSARRLIHRALADSERLRRALNEEAARRSVSQQDK